MASEASPSRVVLAVTPFPLSCVCNLILIGAVVRTPSAPQAPHKAAITQGNHYQTYPSFPLTFLTA